MQLPKLQLSPLARIIWMINIVLLGLGVIYIHYLSVEQQNKATCQDYYKFVSNIGDCTKYYIKEQLCLCNGQLLPLNSEMIKQKNEYIKNIPQIDQGYFDFSSLHLNFSS